MQPKTIFIVFEQYDQFNGTEILEVVSTKLEAQALVNSYNQDVENYESEAFFEEWPINKVDLS